MLTVVGMGPAGLYLTIPAAHKVVVTTDVLVGGKRHLQRFPNFAGEQFALGINIPELLGWISAHQRKHVVILASGGPLFHGIGARMVAYSGIGNVRIIPGISTVQYLCTQSGTDINDMWLTSSHGHSIRFDELVRHNKVTMVTDALCGPREITQQLIARGKGYRWMAIGENLAVENKQTHLLPVRGVNADHGMNAVVILDER